MIEKISDKISVIFTDEGFTKSNSILIEDDIRLMIDSGAGKILNDLKPEKIDILLNSHCHIDHIWDNDLFINARILMHEKEAENINNLRSLGGFENWDRFMDKDLQKYIDMIISVKPSLSEERRVSGFVAEGDSIWAGSTEIQALHTPGHTAGHCSFLIPSEGLLFIGDVCLTKVGPWYGDDITPLDDFIDSINKIIEIKPDRVVSGHNREILSDNITESLIEYRDRILIREEKIIKAISEKPMDIHDLATIPLIYPAHPSIFVLYWEKAMLHKHLTHLIAQGYAEIIDEGKYFTK